MGGRFKVQNSRLQYRFHSFASDDVEHGKQRAGRTHSTAFEFGNVIDREIEIFGQHRLASGRREPGSRRNSARTPEIGLGSPQIEVRLQCAVKIL
jgi:hypothetical protein